MSRVVEEWDHGVTSTRTDPTCQMSMAAEGKAECGRAATVRRSLWPWWSRFWCPEHAAYFDGPREFPPGYFDWMREYLPRELDEPTFVRRPEMAAR